MAAARPGQGGNPMLSASAPSLEALAAGQKSSWKSADFSKFTLRDKEELKGFAHRRSRKVLRSLSFPNLPPGADRTKRRQTTGAAVVAAKKPAENSAVAITLAPLQFALEKGPEAKAAKNFILGARRPLAEDGATDIANDGRSLDWLDSEALSAQLDDLTAAALEELSTSPRSDAATRIPSSPSMEKAFMPPGDIIAASGLFGPGAKSKRAQQRPHLQAVRWPTEDMFDQHYCVPDELLPKPISPRAKEASPLPSGRKSISCLEESTSPGIQSYIYWQFMSSKEQQDASVSQRPWSGKPAGLFETAGIYRQACAQLGVSASEILEPRPVFGDNIEVMSSGRLLGTRQSYAVAEAVRACMPKKMSFKDVIVTDMGAARIVEAAVMAGRLSELRFAGTSLGYRFCTAIHSCLRTRAGNSVTSLSLRGCGLGNYLDVELEDLPPLVASTYVKGLAALPEGIIDPAPVIEEPEPVAAEEEGEDEVAPPPEPDNPMEGKKLTKRQQEELERKEAEERRRKEEEEDEAERKRLEQKKRKQKGMDFDSEEENDEEIQEEQPKEAEIPWWELENPPSRSIPVALPVLLHVARPGCPIRRLDLSCSDLTLEMGRCLGWALSNSHMEALVLDHCSCGDDTLSAITKGLEQNKLLMELSVRGNRLSGEPEPVSELIHVAGRHASLAHLDFAENPIHRDCIGELTSLLRYSCTVLGMHILGYGVHGKDAVQVARACRAWVEEHRTSRDSVATPMIRFDEDSEEDTFGEDEEELILCRARHVEALNDWRITAPEVPQRRKKLTAGRGKPDPVTAPFSWMPSGCWMCKRCSTVDFRWVVPDRGEGDESGSTGARLFVRPSFANFERIELQRERCDTNKRVVFWGQALVPPGTHSYMFESILSAHQQKGVLLCSRGHPSIESAIATMRDQSAHLLELCKEYTYAGRLNVLPLVKEDQFQIPEHPEGDKIEAPEPDPWVEDPVRLTALRGCYEVDLPQLHLDEICHVEEEDEARETIWELYGLLYDTYSMYAGRSSWPDIRQVDVYSFFEDARLLDRGPLSADGECAVEVATSTAEAVGVTGPRSSAGAPSPTHTEQTESAPVSPTSTVGRSSVADKTSVKGSVKSAEASAPVAEAAARADSFSGLQPVVRPLTTQDIQQILVQTITSRKQHVRKDASWSTRRKHLVHQQLREGQPIGRAQFLEVLLRAAGALRGREPSTSEAFRKFADTILSGRIMQPPLSQFPRGLALQAGAVRNTLLSRRKTLRQAYEKYGLNEMSFLRLAQVLKLCDRSFTAKHIASIYALSRRPVKHASRVDSTTLSYDEFSEAVARLALVWQPIGIFASTPGTIRALPPQPQKGKPVNQRAVAARLEAFLGRLTERMKPSVGPRHA